jgi:predicted NUDIX family NTP pyrophosphohydrolase
MPKSSAGLVLYRVHDRGLEVLLGHMGGPFWARKDEGAWTIPKGEFADGEEAPDVARREFVEELGHPVPEGPWLELGTVKQSGGKTVTAWAVAGDLDPATCVSNTVSLEWPPRSGRMQEFPELDRVGWFGPEEAERLLVTAQRAFLDRLAEQLG